MFSRHDPTGGISSVAAYVEGDAQANHALGRATEFDSERELALRLAALEAVYRVKEWETESTTLRRTPTRGFNLVYGSGPFLQSVNVDALVTNAEKSRSVAVSVRSIYGKGAIAPSRILEPVREMGELLDDAPSTYVGGAGHIAGTLVFLRTPFTRPQVGQLLARVIKRTNLHLVVHPILKDATSLIAAQGSWSAATDQVALAEFQRAKTQIPNLHLYSPSGLDAAASAVAALVRP